MYDEFDSGENRDKNLRPKSTLMTESQANLPVVSYFSSFLAFNLIV